MKVADPEGITSSETRPEWKIRRGTTLLAIFLFALLLRSVNIGTLPDDPSILMVPDSSIYLELRDNLLETGRFVRQDGTGGFATEIERVPGYALLLAGLEMIAGKSPWAIISVQATLDSLSATLIAMLGFMINRQVGFFSGLLAAAWPNLVITSAYILSDTLFVFAVSLVLLLFAHALRRPTSWIVLASGLAFGASLMIRPIFQFLPLLLGGILYLAARHHDISRAASLWLMTLFLAASAVFPAPLIYRNLVEFKSPSLTAQGGTHLLGWVVPLVKWHTGKMEYDVAFQQARTGFDHYLAENELTIEGLGSFATSQHKAKYAATLLAEEPLIDLAEAWIKGAVINLGTPAVVADPRIRAARSGSLMEDASGEGWLIRFLSWADNMPIWAVVVIAAGLIGSLAASLLQLAGVIWLWPRSRWACIFGVLLALYILMIMGPVGGAKYRLPFAPAAIIFTACGIAAVSGYLSRKVARHANAT